MKFARRVYTALSKENMWLYIVQNSPACQRILEQAKPLIDVGLITVIDLSATNGFSDKPVPALVIWGCHWWGEYRTKEVLTSVLDWNKKILESEESGQFKTNIIEFRDFPIPAA